MANFSKYAVQFFVLAMTSFCLHAQDLKESSKPEGEEMEAGEVKGETASPPVEDSPALKQARDKFLQTLKSEIESGLIKSDVQRLNRNVMRLGSYRKDWVKDAQDFLATNATLSELYLYRYSMLRNKRLNLRILETLNRIPTFRYPRAAVAFAINFVDDKEEAELLLNLLAKAMEQDPSISTEIFQLLGSVSNRFTLASRLKFAVKACPKISLSATVNKEILKNWKGEASGFWEKVLAAELEPCLQGV